MVCFGGRVQVVSGVEVGCSLAGPVSEKRTLLSEHKYRDGKDGEKGPTSLYSPVPSSSFGEGLSFRFGPNP